MTAAVVELLPPRAAISGVNDVRIFAGTTVTAQCAFLPSGSRVPADPEHVHVAVIDPEGALRRFVYDTDDEVVRIRRGVYAMAVPCVSRGIWTVRFIGIGNGLDVVSEESVRAEAVRASTDSAPPPVSAPAPVAAAAAAGDVWVDE